MNLTKYEREIELDCQHQMKQRIEDLVQTASFATNGSNDKAKLSEDESKCVHEYIRKAEQNLSIKDQTVNGRPTDVI